MDSTTNSLNWFEIPALDIDRSKKFYETVFDLEMISHEMGEMKMAMFPFSPGSGKANGGIAQSPQHKPSVEGTVIYLNANPAMDDVVARVEAAGGKVLLPKMDIGENGFMAMILDTEGNSIGIHSTS
ncbi:MAG: putative enzyme related to lactoylglutathione lyase [Flavobacteriaceae bacterium]|jgi:predicted enzyme related to lactoylglutathione lyase